MIIKRSAFHTFGRKNAVILEFCNTRALKSPSCIEYETKFSRLPADQRNIGSETRNETRMSHLNSESDCDPSVMKKAKFFVVVSWVRG